MSEIEETLERIKSHEGVKGYVIMNNEGEVLRKLPGMSNEKAKEYGEEIYSLARKARHVVRDINPSNDLLYFRLRTKELEVMVAPGEDYMVLVIQQWTPADWEGGKS
mmetsp:Transcript_47030/g.112734  ORF Transcript_47030/g.112734 Transcript_47030/m.112734 type:complete len:107 (-) Transcript_47030:43-363(-)